MPIARRDFLKSCAAVPLAALPFADFRIAPPRPARKLKLLILGGTAFLGPEVVASAKKRGHTVTLFNRGKTNPHLFPDLEKLQGDRDGKLESLKGRVFDGVVDNSGYVPRHVKLSAEALKDSGFYVFVSSVSVYPRMDSEDTDESTAVGTIPDETVEQVTGETYGPLKALCEQAAEKAMPGRVANVRPGLIVGPGDPTDRFTYWPVRVKAGGEVLAPGKPEWGIQYIDVRDLADWIVVLIENKAAGVFNALGPVAPTPMGTLLDTAKAVTRSDATFTWVDPEFLEAEKVAPWQDMPAWFPPGSGKTRPAIVGNTRAVAKGLTFRPLEETIRDLLAWVAARPVESAPTSRAESRRRRRTFGLSREREREVLAAWHASRKK
jgi:2'-hydroxyisoflavone reductase